MWKSAITANLSNNGAVNELHVYSGASTSETRDVIPHGKVNGPVITSARMLIGYFDDWRTGMETFADVNNLVAPRTEAGRLARLSVGRVGEYWPRKTHTLPMWRFQIIIMKCWFQAAFAIIKGISYSALTQGTA